MNVQELIDALSEIPDKSVKVLTEGCDCWGDAVAVSVDGLNNDEDPYILVQCPSEDGGTA